MSAKNYGPAFLYGVGGTVAACAVQSFKTANEAKNTAQVQEEHGNVINRYKDDLTDEATIEVKYKSTFAIPDGNSILVYETFTWEIDKVERAEVNTAHRIVTLAIKKSQYVDSSAVTILTTTAS